MYRWTGCGLWPLCPKQGMWFRASLSETGCIISHHSVGFWQGIVCPKHGNKIEVVVLKRVCIWSLFCPKQGQGFKPSAAHLYPNMDQVSPRVEAPPAKKSRIFYQVKETWTHDFFCLASTLADNVPRRAEKLALQRMLVWDAGPGGGRRKVVFPSKGSFMDVKAKLVVCKMTG